MTGVGRWARVITIESKGGMGGGKRSKWGREGGWKEGGKVGKLKGGQVEREVSEEGRLKGD